jgi:hypothetical protein
MKRTSGYRMVWLGVVVAIMACTGPAQADFTFGEPVGLPAHIANSSSSQYYGDDLCVSACGRLLFFGSMRPGGQGKYDIWGATRTTLNDTWGTPVNPGATINSPADETDPSISVDLLSLFFRSDRPGGFGATDLYVATRATPEAPWSAPVNLGPVVNSTGSESDPSISADGLCLYFSTWRGPRPGGYGGDDIWVTTRRTTDDAWGEPINLGPPINTLSNDSKPSISSDGLALFFNSSRPGGLTPSVFDNSDMYVSTRPSKDDPWGAPVNLGAWINQASQGMGAYDPDVSSDGSVVYFGAPNRRAGDEFCDFWQAPIIPIVDFDGDGKVDSFEICKMADRWGTDDSLCNIGPMPWGDGTVDAEDLKVLAKYIGEPVDDPTLVGHWAMDETAGFTARDRAGENDGTVMGIAAWRPDTGKITGALELNGTTFITAKSILSPADGPFSVLAWIKGGAPGQAVISQAGGANWLTADVATGALMTELSKGGRTGSGLSSQTVITDGNWHRIAFTWDGANRRLHVDGVLAAEDAQDSLAPSSGNVIIGTAKNMAPGTFWKGLIDDVRIYSRAVKP